MALYEVRFWVYNNPQHTSYDPNLSNCSVQVQASNSSQAQAMVEAQYGGCASVQAVYPIN